MKAVYALFFLFLITASSCRQKWDEGDKEAFYTACTEEAKSNWAGNDTVAKSYCDCIFEKMAKKYPNEQDMLEHIDILAKDTGLIKCKEEVIKK